MLTTKFFPTLLIILDIFAAIAYGFDGDIRKTLYWVSAAVLTICVTW